MIQIKRAYEPSSRKDGYRVLVDRLWPRGIKKQELALDDWLKDIAPSSELRKEFGHDPSHWKSFVSAYKRELRSSQAQTLLEALEHRAESRTLTLVYGARDESHNNAVVLKSILEKKLAKAKR
jgi:uncharacterized protein YeaO (DUF488 family)